MTVAGVVEKPTGGIAVLYVMFTIGAFTTTDAFVIANVCWVAVEPVWFASPA
jgi:hypothetical protein